MIALDLELGSPKAPDVSVRHRTSARGNSRKHKLLEAWGVSKLYGRGQVPAGGGGKERREEGKWEETGGRWEGKKENENALESLHGVCI